MSQESFIEHLSTVLTELGIDNRIIRLPNDTKFGHCDIVIKVDDDLIFRHLRPTVFGAMLNYFIVILINQTISFLIWTVSLNENF